MKNSDLESLAIIMLSQVERDCEAMECYLEERGRALSARECTYLPNSMLDK